MNPTDPTSIALRQIAREHAREHRSKVTFVPGQGWLCSRCDDDYHSFEWAADELDVAEHFDGTTTPEGR